MTVQSFLKKLRFLQIVLLAGYSLAISITLLLAYLDELPLLPELKTNEYIDIIAIASGVAGVIAAFFLFQQLLLRVDENHSFSRKLSAFKTAFILRLILIESVGMLSVVLFMISMNIIPIISAICIAVLLGLLKPSKNEMIKILRLSPGEQVKLNSSNTVLGDVHQQLFKHRMN